MVRGNPKKACQITRTQQLKLASLCQMNIRPHLILGDFLESSSRQTLHLSESIESGPMEDGNRRLHPTFFVTANSLSKFHNQSVEDTQRISRAGERHGLEKITGWINEKLQGGNITSEELTHYLQLQVQLDYDGANSLVTSRPEAQESNPPSLVFPSLVLRDTFEESIGSSSNMEENPIPFGGFQSGRTEMNEFPGCIDGGTCELHGSDTL